MNKYLNQFFSLRCAGDVLNAVGPISKGPKEITEAMSMRELLVDIMLPNPMKYVLVDMCSGNALVPAISSFTLPSYYNIAVDKKKRDLRGINRFSYIEEDIHNLYCLTEISMYKTIYQQYRREKGYILTAMHACKELSKQVINIFLRSPECGHLFLCPCCVGTTRSPASRFVDDLKHTTKYDAWIVELIEYIAYNKMLTMPLHWNDNNVNVQPIGIRVDTDRHSLSPRNRIIHVWREYEEE